MNGLLGWFNHSAHLQFSVYDGEGEPPFNQVDRVPAELFVAPAAQDFEVLAHARRQRLEIIRARDQPRRDARLLRADLEQQLQEVADQRGILGESGPPRLAVSNDLLEPLLDREENRTRWEAPTSPRPEQPTIVSTSYTAS